MGIIPVEQRDPFRALIPELLQATTVDYVALFDRETVHSALPRVFPMRSMLRR
jgi:hypothetical protein